MKKAKSAVEALVSYVVALTPEQVDKLLERLPLEELAARVQGNAVA